MDPKQRLYQRITPFKMTKGDRRKVAILEAAIECIATRGFSHTNYETVGRIAGMQRAHVAYHFPDKEELFLGAIRFVFAAGQEIVVARMKKARTAPQRLDAYLEGTVDWVCGRPRFGPTLALLQYQSTVDPRYRALGTEFRRMAVERMRELVPPAVAEEVHSLVLGQIVVWLSCETGLTRQGLLRSLKASVGRYLKAANVR